MRHQLFSNPRRRGFTILEMMISMVILVAVMGAAASIYKMQARTVTEHAGRLEAQQNARFALNVIERELRMGGVALAPGQPPLVLASPYAITFNTNLVSKDETDRSAVYVNADADDRTVGSFLVSKALPLPGTTDPYPDTTYWLAHNTASRAETISYWLEQDGASTRGDEYILYRRVNHAPPMMITRGVIVGPNDTVFQYFSYDTTNMLKPIPHTKLPATHVAKMHKAAGDTGALALIDSIRAVKIRFRTLYKDPRGRDAIREYAGRVTILNIGVAQRATCGEPPLSGGSPTAKLLTNADGNPYVQITWTPSTDEEQGEKDVERYAIYRRAPTDSIFQEPMTSIPAGELSYVFEDSNVEPGAKYVYGVAAQDCSPAMSLALRTSEVAIPADTTVVKGDSLKIPLDTIIKPPIDTIIKLPVDIPLDPFPIDTASKQ